MIKKILFFFFQQTSNFRSKGLLAIDPFITDNRLAGICFDIKRVWILYGRSLIIVTALQGNYDPLDATLKNTHVHLAERTSGIWQDLSYTPDGQDHGETGSGRVGVGRVERGDCCAAVSGVTQLLRWVQWCTLSEKGQRCFDMQALAVHSVKTLLFNTAVALHRLVYWNCWVMSFHDEPPIIGDASNRNPLRINISCTQNISKLYRVF